MKVRQQHELAQDKHMFLPRLCALEQGDAWPLYPHLGGSHGHVLEVRRLSPHSPFVTSRFSRLYVPIGLFTGADIVLSNLSLTFITVSLFTIVKSGGNVWYPPTLFSLVYLILH